MTSIIILLPVLAALAILFLFLYLSANKKLSGVTGKYQGEMEKSRFLEERLKTQQEEAGRIEERMKISFENLASQVLENKSEKFVKQNQASLENILLPLRDRIRDFEKKVEETYDKESRQRFSLEKEVRRLYDLNQTLSKEANNLTNALKADTKRQGNWGEVILERILEASGLQKGIHYFLQESVRDEAGDIKRPDVTIALPEKRYIIVDSKMSLTAYERYCAAEENGDRAGALKAHLLSVRNHIDELNAKKYEDLYKNSPDFILLFIPVEPAFSLALMTDNSLYDYAFKKRIILVSISTLLATLRIVDSIWRLEKQNENAEEIVRQGTALYEKFAGFVDDMRTLGKTVGQAQKAYDDAMNKLSTGRGNLLSKAENMRKLGLNPKKELPRDLAEKNEPETDA